MKEDDEKPTIVERFKRWCENHPIISLAIIFVMIISALSAFTDAVEKTRKGINLLFGSKQVAQYPARMVVIEFKRFTFERGMAQINPPRDGVRVPLAAVSLKLDISANPQTAHTAGNNLNTIHLDIDNMVTEIGKVISVDVGPGVNIIKVKVLAQATHVFQTGVGPFTSQYGLGKFEDEIRIVPTDGNWRRLDGETNALRGITSSKYPFFPGNDEISAFKNGVLEYVIRVE